MALLLLYIFSFATYFVLTASQNTPFDPLNYVNQLIITDNGSNVFADATFPYEMAKTVADVDGQNTARFSMDGSNVTGFSHMHDSGTGGGPPSGTSLCFRNSVREQNQQLPFPESVQSNALCERVCGCKTRVFCPQIGEWDCSRGDSHTKCCHISLHFS